MIFFEQDSNDLMPLANQTAVGSKRTEKKKIRTPDEICYMSSILYLWIIRDGPLGITGGGVTRTVPQKIPAREACLNKKSCK